MSKWSGIGMSLSEMAVSSVDLPGGRYLRYVTSNGVPYISFDEVIFGYNNAIDNWKLLHISAQAAATKAVRWWLVLTIDRLRILLYSVKKGKFVN